MVLQFTMAFAFALFTSVSGTGFQDEDGDNDNFTITIWEIVGLVLGVFCCCAASTTVILALGKNKKVAYGTQIFNADTDATILAKEFMLKYKYSMIRQKFFVMPFLLFFSSTFLIVGAFSAAEICADASGDYLYDSGCLHWHQMGYGAIGTLVQLGVVLTIYYLPMEYGLKHEVLYYVNVVISILIYTAILVNVFLFGWLFQLDDAYNWMGFLNYWTILGTLIYAQVRSVRVYEIAQTGPTTWNVFRSNATAAPIFMCIFMFLTMPIIGFIAMCIVCVAINTQLRSWTLQYTQSRGFELFSDMGELKCVESSLVISTERVHVPTRTMLHQPLQINASNGTQDTTPLLWNGNQAPNQPNNQPNNQANSYNPHMQPPPMQYMQAETDRALLIPTAFDQLLTSTLKSELESAETFVQLQDVGNRINDAKLHNQIADQELRELRQIYIDRAPQLMRATTKGATASSCEQQPNTKQTTPPPPPPPLRPTTTTTPTAPSSHTNDEPPVYSKSTWNCMALEKDQALLKLQNEPEGTFIVRPSESAFAVLSVMKADGNTAHFFVNHNEITGDLSVQGSAQNHKTLDDMVQFFARSQQSPLPCQLQVSIN